MTSASVAVGGEVVGAIGAGLCTFVGVTHSDGPETAVRMARRLWGLRIFEDDAGLSNRSVEQTGGEVLVVSQFTLYADTTRGRRPSYTAAARPEQARAVVGHLVRSLRSLGPKVATGEFGADMVVSLVNDGPFTIMVEIP